MDELVKPVATAKPVRGREMKSTVLPSVKNVSDRKGQSLTTDVIAKEKGDPEVYHEGYVDGKLYLVPDSNLEAMKDLINFEMRPRKSIRYKHQTSYEISDYDHFRGRLNNLLTKIDQIGAEAQSETSEEKKETEEESEKSEKIPSIVSSKEKSSSEKSSESEEIEAEEEPEEESKIESEEESEKELEEESEEELEEESEEELEEESEKELEEESEKALEEESEKELEEESEEPEEESEKEPEEEPKKEEEETVKSEPEVIGKPFTKPELDRNYLRYLVSGHFRKDKKPIYIIQEYDGEPDVFGNQKADFSSVQKEGDIDIFISGKFYKESILEEFQGKPVALKTEPGKILINEETSEIYDTSFTNVFNMKNADITMKGEFIKNEIINQVTPFLTLGIAHKASETTNTDENTYTNSKNATTVLINSPKFTSPFSHKENYSKYQGSISESSNGSINESGSSTVSQNISTDTDPSKYSTQSSKSAVSSHEHMRRESDKKRVEQRDEMFAPNNKTLDRTKNRNIIVHSTLAESPDKPIRKNILIEEKPVDERNEIFASSNKNLDGTGNRKISVRKTINENSFDKKDQVSPKIQTERDGILKMIKGNLLYKTFFTRKVDGNKTRKDIKHKKSKSKISDKTETKIEQSQQEENKGEYPATKKQARTRRKKSKNKSPIHSGKNQ